jgi:tetratricopeptide (TPR) repeat protein
MEESGLDQSVIENALFGGEFNMGRVELERGNFEDAKKRQEAYAKHAYSLNNPLQIRLAHQLAGMIALKSGDYQAALDELAQANQQNPYNIYRMAQAQEGLGHLDEARQLYEQAANFNVVNNLNYAFIRNKARQKADLLSP